MLGLKLNHVSKSGHWSNVNSSAVGELHKMVNYFVNDHFWWVISPVLYLMWKPSFNDACKVCNDIECVKINLMFCGSSCGTNEFSQGNSTALCLLVNAQRRICANRFDHSLGWCEACGFNLIFKSCIPEDCIAAFHTSFAWINFHNRDVKVVSNFCIINIEINLT